MSLPESVAGPPRNDEYTIAEPVLFSAVTKASAPPLSDVSKAPAVTGKSAEFVGPVIQALKEASSAMPDAPSLFEPPITVENNRPDPMEFSLVTNTSLKSGVVSNAPGVVGKSAEPVPPET